MGSMGEAPGYSIPGLVAGADLSSSQFHAVNLDSNGDVVLSTAGGQTVGALGNKPQDTEAATVNNTGVVYMKAGAAISKGAAVQVGTGGKIVTHTTGVSIGRLLSVAAGADGDIIPVLLTASLAIPSTAVVGDQSAIVSLTDNSGGTGSDTIADITEANNAGSADRVPVENAFATVSDKIEEILGALRDSGLISS